MVITLLFYIAFIDASSGGDLGFSEDVICKFTGVMFITSVDNTNKRVEI